MATIYRDEYPAIDRDVVVAGALLHDLGKIDAYSMSPIPEITPRGAVLDHIALGYDMFEKLADEAGLNPNLRVQIAHILLSHHGQKEFGSPVLPATQEALIAAAADEPDFRLFCWKDAVKPVAGGGLVVQAMIEGSIHGKGLHNAKRQGSEERRGDENLDDGIGAT